MSIKKVKAYYCISNKSIKNPVLHISFHFNIKTALGIDKLFSNIFIYLKCNLYFKSNKFAYSQMI